MEALQVTLLGTFAVSLPDGTPIRIETRKARALLSILVMARGRALSRDYLAGLLWSRGEMRQSLASLSQALYSLHRALEGVAADLFLAQVESVAVDVSKVWVDALALEAAARTNTEAGRRDVLALYCGPFLDDLAIDTEEAFAEWRNAEGARLEELAARNGTDLMRDWESNPLNAEEALVERLLSVDPYNEPATRIKMQLLVMDGRQAASLLVAEDFKKRLAADLAIAPTAALAQLTERIQDGDINLDPHGSGTLVAATKHRWWILPAAAVLVLIASFGVWTLLMRAPESAPEEIRLLVRPFEAETGVEADLANGFADDLATALIRRSGLQILSRETGRLVPENDDARSGASHVLKGRMRAEGDLWVLNLWVTETESGREIWAQRFQGSPEAPRALRDEVVVHMTDRVGHALLPGNEQFQVLLPEQAVPAYLKALGQIHNGTAASNAGAIDAMTTLAKAHPDAIEPVAALALAYERVAFEADDYAREARLHWMQGYLLLKKQLTGRKTEHPDLLAARARLALRRLDFKSAEALARSSHKHDKAHIAAHEVLAITLALQGDTGAARAAALRAITLSPANPSDGYTALALSAFAEGNLSEAAEVTRTALNLARQPSLELLVLNAAVLGLLDDPVEANAAFETLVAALESRPYGAWRMGRVTYTNPRDLTWRRPSAGTVAMLVRFAEPELNARLQDGLLRAADPHEEHKGWPAEVPLSAAQVDDLLFDRQITGQPAWLVQQGWSQVRTEDGHLFQKGAFGPLPAAKEGRSRIVNNRLCDQWEWRNTEMSNCQLVVPTRDPGVYVLVGETGRFPFSAD